METPFTEKDTKVMGLKQWETEKSLSVFSWLLVSYLCLKGIDCKMTVCISFNDFVLILIETNKENEIQRHWPVM